MASAGSAIGNPTVSVAMLGARMHYAVPRVLNDAGMLKRFFTDSYIGNKPWLRWALQRAPANLRPGWVKRWLGRQHHGLPPNKIVSFDALGIWYAMARQRAAKRTRIDEVAARAAVAFNRQVIAAGLDGTEVLWGYNTASLEAFRFAHEAGLRCMLEQTLLPIRLEFELLAFEEKRWPGWSRASLADVPSALAEREEAEWRLADRIAVGSNFVREGLVRLGVPQSKIVVIPYGVDPTQFPVTSAKKASDGSALKVLFVGQVGLRKGVPDLLAAVTRIPAGAIDVRIAGPITIKPTHLQGLPFNVLLLGSVPRSEVIRLFAWADVLVLPSIAEGSATVTYEALMSGCPVITTPNAGSIVRDNVDGFIVPIRDPAALAAALMSYVRDRKLLAAHRQAATASRERVGIDRYGAEVVRAVRELMPPATPC